MSWVQPLLVDAGALLDAPMLLYLLLAGWAVFICVRFSQTVVRSTHGCQCTCGGVSESVGTYVCADDVLCCVSAG